jgi:chromosomal replication initiation ATPase DnaA
LAIAADVGELAREIRAPRRRLQQDSPLRSRAATERNAEAPRAAAAEDDRLSRIRYLVAGAYAVGYDDLRARPRADATAALARSAAIAIARDVLLADLTALARHFGCRDAEEAAGHCNLIAAKTERDGRFRITHRFLKAACARAVGCA